MPKLPTAETVTELLTQHYCSEFMLPISLALGSAALGLLVLSEDTSARKDSKTSTNFEALTPTWSLSSPQSSRPTSKYMSLFLITMRS